MSWNVDLVVTSATNGTPVPGVSIVEPAPDGRQLAVTDDSGAARVSLDRDTSTNNVLYIGPFRYTVEGTGDRAPAKSFPLFSVWPSALKGAFKT